MVLVAPFFSLLYIFIKDSQPCKFLFFILKSVAFTPATNGSKRGLVRGLEMTLSKYKLIKQKKTCKSIQQWKLAQYRLRNLSHSKPAIGYFTNRSANLLLFRNFTVIMERTYTNNFFMSTALKYLFFQMIAYRY